MASSLSSAAGLKPEEHLGWKRLITQALAWHRFEVVYMQNGEMRTGFTFGEDLPAAAVHLKEQGIEVIGLQVT